MYTSICSNNFYSKKKKKIIKKIKIKIKNIKIKKYINKNY